MKGKITHSIGKDTPTFPMTNGVSTDLLLELPEYQSPYDISIVSEFAGIGFTTTFSFQAALF